MYSQFFFGDCDQADGQKYPIQEGNEFEGATTKRLEDQGKKFERGRN